MNFVGSYTRRLYYFALEALPYRLSVALTHYRATGHWPNLSNPKSFNERLQARKVYDRNPLLPILADKIAVKDHVSKILGQAWVTPNIWSGEKLPARKHRTWPAPFVLKSSHGSGQAIFVRSEAELDWDAIEITVASWLRSSYGRGSREWLYSKINPRLLIEPFISNDLKLPIDYKFFVFSGKAVYIQVDTGRDGHHKRAFYDRDWNHQPFGLGFPLEERPISRPRHLTSMLDAAERLGRDFSFVRVDLYDVASHPRFGETTFYPGAGNEPFMPPEWNMRLGQEWAEAAAARRTGKANSPI